MTDKKKPTAMRLAPGLLKNLAIISERENRSITNLVETVMNGYCKQYAADYLISEGIDLGSTPEKGEDKK